jgi:hypothetical protein
MFGVLLFLFFYLADPLSLTYYAGGGVVAAMRGNLRLALTFAAGWAVLANIAIWIFVWAAIPDPMTDEWRYACFSREWLYTLGSMTRDAWFVYFPVRIIVGL